MGLRSIFLLINLEMIICSQTADSHGTQITFSPYKLKNDYLQSDGRFTWDSDHFFSYKLINYYLQSDGRFTWDSDHFFFLNLEMIICSKTADSHGTQITFSA